MLNKKTERENNNTPDDNVKKKSSINLIFLYEHCIYQCVRPVTISII